MKVIAHQHKSPQHDESAVLSKKICKRFPDHVIVRIETVSRLADGMKGANFSPYRRLAKMILGKIAAFGQQHQYFGY